MHNYICVCKLFISIFKCIYLYSQILSDYIFTYDIRIQIQTDMIECVTQHGYGRMEKGAEEYQKAAHELNDDIDEVKNNEAHVDHRASL